MKTSKQPFAWVQKIDESLRQIDAVPIRGNAQRIAVEEIKRALSTRFGLEELDIRIEEGSWKKADQLVKGLGVNPIRCGIKLLPITQEAIWLMSRKEVQHLVCAFLCKEKDQEISSETLQDGFYRYLLLHAIDCLQGLDPFQAFSLELNDEALLKEEDSYCVDVYLSPSQDLICRGRLILSKDLLIAWRQFFASQQRPFCLSPLAKSIELTTHLKMGSVLLDRPLWDGLEAGDVILLDRGSFDPRHKEGVITLTLGTTPLFHVSIKENKVKLLDYALFYEEDMQNEQEITPKELLAPDEGVANAIKDLPLNVTIELARLRMSVDQLMQLSPGNFLQLPIHPEQGVTLSINGQKVGRGEMVYLGEALGVRILELSDQ